MSAASRSPPEKLRRVAIPKLDLAAANLNSYQRLGESEALQRQTSSPSDFFSGVIYGFVNAILTIPCMYGYSAIIFSHNAFTPYRPQLAKLVLFSSAVHQIVFTCRSSLPFAIGQVQDAGLIFLSTMATSIAVLGLEEGWDASTIVATTLVATAASTCLLGMALVVIGRLRLASLVSYLPAPVVGGYLAFIGFFCFDAGLNLCTNVVFTGLILEDVGAFRTVFMSSRHLIHIAPAAASGVLFLVVSRRVKHIFALPGAILVTLVVFYGYLLCAGITVEEARGQGWLDALPGDTNQPFWLEFELYNLHEINSSAFFPLLPTWIGMTFVVSFSSCLDVSAIEMDMGKPLKIDHELVTVGWSNFCSGLCGGFTGSYIFSQTIFTYRANLGSRVCGVVVIFAELFLVAAPVPLMSYVPRFFFAATLMFIAFDLLIEWLIEARHKMLLRDYIILLFTFGFILVLGLEQGMAAAVALAMANFVWSYSQTSKMILERGKSPSNVLTHFDERERLLQAHQEICVLKLHGYLFFGSAVELVKEVKKAIFVDVDNQFNKSREVSQVPPLDFLSAAESLQADLASNPTSMKTPNLLSPLSSDGWITRKAKQNRSHQSAKAKEVHGKDEVSAHSSVVSLFEMEQGKRQSAFVRSISILPTRVVVLDFSRVTGIDATAVRACFMVLEKLCENYSVDIVAAGCSKDVEFLLNANGLERWHPGKYESLEEALQDVEKRVSEQSEHIPRIKAAKHISSGTSTYDGKLCTAILQMARSGTRINREEADLLLSVENWFGVADKFEQNEKIFGKGSASERLYIVRDGEVLLKQNVDAPRSPDDVTIREGFVFGDASFFLMQKHTYAAIAQKTGTSVWFLSQEKYKSMARVDPALYSMFNLIMLRIASRQVAWARNFG